MLDQLAAEQYANTFLGYGNLDAPIWFIGMEEGGVMDARDLQTRIAAWSDLGKPEVVNLRDFHKRIGVTRWFTATPPLQPTWRPLMRAALTAAGLNVSDGALRTYQATTLASAAGDVALLELMPFPSRSTREWPYAALGIDAFADRETYVGTLREGRLQTLQHRLRTCAPRAAVFYGNPRFWRERLTLHPFNAKLSVRRDGTLLIATMHPTAHGSTNAQWDEIGRMIRDHQATARA
jgi:hypothetical protein